MPHYKHIAPFLVFLITVTINTATAQSNAAELATLPEGRWTGPITTRTIPDVDKDGEWQAEVVIENCSGKKSVQFKKDDGTYGTRIVMESVSFVRTHILISAATENQDLSGWSETQVWTLVDARPKGWTITQSRSVINQGMSPEDAWFTFRRLAWGGLEYDPQWCSSQPK